MQGESIDVDLPPVMLALRMRHSASCSASVLPHPWKSAEWVREGLDLVFPDNAAAGRCLLCSSPLTFIATQATPRSALISSTTGALCRSSEEGVTCRVTARPHSLLVRSDAARRRGGGHLLAIACIPPLGRMVDTPAVRRGGEVPTGERGPGRLGDRAEFVALVLHVMEPGLQW
jgi:hypothetical protein